MVAEAARTRGHHVSEMDVYAQGNDADTIKNFITKSNPEYIGLSLRNLDSANYNKQDFYLEGYKSIIKIIRLVSSARIILGGSAYTIFPDLLLSELNADYGVAGEGEYAFCSLIEQLEKDPQSAPRIRLNDPVLSGNEFAAHNRNKALADFYLKNGGMLSVQTKRGCPFRCAYCSYPLLEGRRYRLRDPKDVVDEIDMLVKMYQMDYYSITDSVFNDSAGHYLEVAEELIKREISIPWMCFLRPDYFKQEEVELLKKSGLSAVEWGSDCTTDITLEAMRKSFTWDLVESSNNIFARAGISNAHFIIFGGPQETHETIKQGLDNLQKLKKCVVFAGIGVRIFPNTEIYQRAIKEGQINPQQNLLPPTYYFSDKIDINIMHSAILEAFKGKLDRVYPDGQYVETASTYHLLGNRGPAWDMLLRKNIKR